MKYGTTHLKIITVPGKRSCKLTFLHNVFYVAVTVYVNSVDRYFCNFDCPNSLIIDVLVTLACKMILLTTPPGPVFKST